jgi:hypothetical protein
MSEVDFYAELYKSICEEETVEETESICLITKENLETNSLTLQCDHTFNYLPLFQEIRKQKNCGNHLNNIKNTDHKYAFKYTQIMCPYCRTIDNSLLPYHDTLDVPKIIGVNWLKPACGYVYRAGKQKNQVCGKSTYNVKTYNLKNEIIHNVEDAKTNYCKQHCRIVLKKENENTVTCQGILKSGKRKGQTCNNVCKGESVVFCKKHRVTAV